MRWALAVMDAYHRWRKRRHAKRHRQWLRRNGIVGANPDPGRIVDNWRGRYH